MLEMGFGKKLILFQPTRSWIRKGRERDEKSVLCVCLHKREREGEREGEKVREKSE